MDLTKLYGQREEITFDDVQKECLLEPSKKVSHFEQMKYDGSTVFLYQTANEDRNQYLLVCTDLTMYEVLYYADKTQEQYRYKLDAESLFYLAHSVENFCDFRYVCKKLARIALQKESGGPDTPPIDLGEDATPITRYIYEESTNESCRKLAFKSEYSNGYEMEFIYIMSENTLYISFDNDDCYKTECDENQYYRFMNSLLLSELDD